MKPFQVLLPGGFLDPSGIEIAIQSFAELYHTVTPKHKKRLKLTIIEEPEYIESLQENLVKIDIAENTTIIDRNEVESVTNSYQEASIFFYPSEINSYKIISEALSFGIPVLTYENMDSKSFIDNSCGIMIRKRNENMSAEAFSKMLKMLYFDPEVRKILAKGANYKFNGEKSWQSQGA